MNDKGMSAIEAAEFLGLTPQTLANFRFLGRGPAYSKLGRRVIYLKPDLDWYLKKNRVDPENTVGENQP